MVIEPFFYLAFLVFDGYQFFFDFFYYFRESAQAQSTGPYPYSPQCRYFILGSGTTTITSLVTHSALDDVSVIHKFSQGAFVIEAPWAIFERVQVRDRERIQVVQISFIHGRDSRISIYIGRTRPIPMVVLYPTPV